MTSFRPTLGYDWEIALLDGEFGPLPRPRIQRLVDRIAKELPYTHAEEQDGYYEHKVGVCRGFPELYERTSASLGRLCEMLAEEGAHLYSSGSPPVSWCFTGCHMHAGTHFEPGPAYALRNVLTPYTPLFAALMGNSPMWRGANGRYKSYRMGLQARGDACLRSVVDAVLTQGEWGADVSARHPDPTLEARVMDTPFSWRLACECATLWCALATRRHRQGCQPDDAIRDRLREYADNRARAVREGLQATFVWQGAEVPVTELLAGVLEECAEELGELGLPKPSLIAKALAKRRNQADFQLALLAQTPDQGSYIARLARLSPRPEAFEQHLDAADPLPILPVSSVDDRIVAEAGRGAPRSYLETLWPATMVEHDALFGRLETEGRLVRETGPAHLYRAGGAAAQRTPEAEAIDLLYPPIVVGPTGAPATEQERARVCARALHRMPSGYLLRDWEDLYIGLTCRADLAELRQASEELFAACRRAAEEEGLVFAPSGQDVGRKFDAHFRVAACAFDTAREGLEALARVQPALLPLTALLTNSYSERRPPFVPTKAAAQGPWIEWSWDDLLTPTPAWRFALNTQRAMGRGRLRWTRGRLALFVDPLDAPTSPGVMAESAALVASVVREYASRTGTPTGGAEQATRAAENWCCACVDGLQATLWSPEGPTGAAELGLRLLSESGDQLARFGAAPDDLSLVAAMLAKRQTQADLQAALWVLDADHATRQARRARVSARPDAFEEYLAAAPTLPPLPHRTAEEIMLALIGIDTPMDVPFYAFPLPHVSRSAILRSLEADGRIRIRHDERKGPLLTRLGA